MTSFQTISTIQTGRDDPQCSSDASCDLNLSTEQEDTMRTYLGNLLNILMERHDGLLSKLKHYGIDKKICLWIYNFLKKQETKCHS